MKCQILFTWKNKKYISKCHQLKILPSMHSVKVFKKKKTDILKKNIKNIKKKKNCFLRSHRDHEADTLQNYS